MNRTIRWNHISLLAAVAIAAGCSTTATRPEIVGLESELQRLRDDPRIGPFATQELSDANIAIVKIRTDAHKYGRDNFKESVYLADRLLDIAEAKGLARFNDRRTAQLESERMQLASQLRDAETTRMASTSITTTDASLREIQQQLSDLQTRATDRGLVVTSGGVLFEVDRAELKPGAERDLDRLVSALREHPDLNLVIEGHTDATGATDYNRDLSQRRADAVRRYLSANGISPDRLQPVGLGEQYPVATNDTSAGRQQNRRVELVLQPIETRVGAADQE